MGISRGQIRDYIAKKKQKSFNKQIHISNRVVRHAIRQPLAFPTWLLIGASVTGNGHKKQNIPCQDAHLINYWTNGWGVAIVSDGAGSARHSHIASSFLVEEAARQAYYLVKRRRWLYSNVLPSTKQWEAESKALIYNIQEALIFHSEKIGIPLHDLHATLIIVIFSPVGLLCVHVGDGRVGYLDRSGNYDSLITPFEGEQAGQTAFITSDLQKHRHIIGSSILNKTPQAFFLLTDGCENVCWQTIQQDASGKYNKLNKPFAPFFEQTIPAIRKMHQTLSTLEIHRQWNQYLDSGYKGFISESDDKTMIIGITV